MAISINSSTVYKTHTWTILIKQCPSYDHLENIIVKYIIDPSTHGILSHPLSMIFWPPTHVISNPLPIVFTPLSLCPLYIKSLYMVLWPLAPMVYRKPCLWYIDPHCLWYFNPTTQVMINPYLCYIKPYVYGILILPMVFWPPNYGTSIAFVLNC